MMFLHYFATGASLPLMSLYLNQELGFGGSGAGLILSFASLAAFISPLLGAFVTDRIMSAERLFALVEFLAAVAIFLLYLQRSFLPVLLCYLFYMSLMVPATAISNTIVFHHSPDRGNSFGGIRLWGTIGWVCSGWLFSFFWLRLGKGSVSDALVATAVVDVLLGMYALTLPSSRSSAPRRKELFPRAAFKVFTNPGVILVGITAFLMQITQRYYYFGIPPYLRSLGFSDAVMLPAMSLGQVMEAVSMLFLVILFRFFSYRTVMMLGVTMEICRFLAFYLGTSPASALLGIAFHGPSFAFFFTVSFIYINTFADKESRAGVQQLFFLIIEGFGTLAGSLLSGFVYDRATGVDGIVDYHHFWGVPLVLAFSVFSLTVLLRLIPGLKSRTR